MQNKLDNTVKIPVYLTDMDINNLLALLDRTTITGIKEVQAFNAIMSALTSAIPKEQIAEE